MRALACPYHTDRLFVSCWQLASTLDDHRVPCIRIPSVSACCEVRVQLLLYLPVSDVNLAKYVVVLVLVMLLQCAQVTIFMHYF